MAKTIQQVNKENAELRKANKELIAKHIQDTHEMQDLRDSIEKGMMEIEDAYSIFLKSITEQYGEPVLDEETMELLGKRFEFHVERANDDQFNMSESPADDEARWLAKITLSVTYSPEKGE